nr:MAG TPA: hypothetical protein [Caudoviricetes sp.]
MIFNLLQLAELAYIAFYLLKPVGKCGDVVHIL